LRPVRDDNQQQEQAVAKIKVKSPVVEMGGDEMTRIIWRKIARS